MPDGGRMHMNTITVNRGDIIFREGDYAKTMFDIQSGSVGVYSHYGTEHEKQITVLGSDEVLGEMGLIEAYPRSATAVALEDGTVLLEISEAELASAFSNRPDKVLKIMRQIASRLRETNEKYINACRAVYENEEADKNGTEKSTWLRTAINDIFDEHRRHRELNY